MVGISSTGFRLFCSPLRSNVSSVSVGGCNSGVSKLSSTARLSLYWELPRPLVAGFRDWAERVSRGRETVTTSENSSSLEVSSSCAVTFQGGEGNISPNPPSGGSINDILYRKLKASKLRIKNLTHNLREYDVIFSD
jgi:hypothetical protein